MFRRKNLAKEYMKTMKRIKALEELEEGWMMNPTAKRLVYFQKVGLEDRLKDIRRDMPIGQLYKVI